MRVHSTYILTTEDAAADDEDEICRELCLWRASVLSTLVFETKTWMEAATALEGLQV